MHIINNRILTFIYLNFFVAPILQKNLPLSKRNFPRPILQPLLIRSIFSIIISLESTFATPEQITHGLENPRFSLFWNNKLILQQNLIKYRSKNIQIWSTSNKTMHDLKHI